MQIGICEEVMYRIETNNFILELIPGEHQDEYPYPTNNSLRVKVSSYGFSADNYIDADELHLTYFAVELNKLYETLQGSAKLEDPYGARSYIEFIARSGGHIRVVGRINNNEAHGFEQELSFDNEIDQTYLRGFAKALFNDYGKYAE